MSTRARVALGLLALGACGGPRRDASGPGRAQQGAPLPRAVSAVDVTSAWDAEPPAKGSGDPLVTLTAQWAIKDPLPLREMSARVVVQGPLAFTELHLVFENTTNHLIEANSNKLVVPSWARLDLRLPAGGTVARFAHQTLDGWREAEMTGVSHDRPPCMGDWWTPKTPPDETQETPGHPAHFGANVEPIDPHARKAIVVAFTQPLVTPGEPYRLPLLGLPKLERFDAEVRFPLDPAGKAVRVRKQAWTPDRDWVVDAPAGQPSAIRSGPFLVVRIDRPTEAADPEPATHIAVLVDTSASRADRLEADGARLAGIVEELGRTAPHVTIDVAAFDQEIVHVYSGRAAGFGAAELGPLLARGALGATDVGRALRWASRRGADRIVLLSDGVPTLGGRTASDLAPDLDALKAAGAKRLDVTTSAGERGAALLESLAMGLEKPGVVLSPGDAGATVARLAHATTERIEVQGAVWSWPKQTPAGAPVLLFAELPPGASVDVRISGRSIPLRVREVASPLVAHEAARAEVAGIESRPAPSPKDSEPDRAVLASLSTRYRVLSRESRWIVPDSEQQYATLGVDRPSTPVITVGAADVEANARAPLKLLPAKRTICLPGPSDVQQYGETSPNLSPMRREHLYFNDLVGRSWVTPVRVVLEKGREGFSAKELSALKEKLQDFLFRRNPAPKSLEVEGYCNESKVESENSRVSRARAMAFRDALLKIGIDARARGYGSLPPLTGFFEYLWRDGAGPAATRTQPDRMGTSGRVGPDSPALGDRPKGEVALRLVLREPAKALAPAAAPYAGKLGDVLSTQDHAAARDKAEAWHAQAASEPMAALALGLARDRAGDGKGAARAFGSLLDLAPGSASMGRSTAAFLDKVDGTLASEVLKETGTLEKDQAMTSRWALGLALARAGMLEESVEALASTLDAWMGVRSLNNGDMSDFRELERVFLRTPSVLDVLEHELSVLAAVVARAHPEKKESLKKRLAQYGIGPATGPSLRIVLTWEADTDVDLEVESGGRPWDPGASTARDALPGEGIVTDDSRAFGPEEYVVSGATRAYPYKVMAQLRGPAANVLGRVDVLDYDGDGHLRIDERPFVVQTEGGTVEVVTVDARHQSG